MSEHNMLPEGWALVPQSLIDTFPEINPINYDHDDACDLNQWGCEVVTSAVSAPQPVAQPSERTHATAPPHVYVQDVPSHCDRIVWRGSYYHLPLPVTQPKPEQAAQTERKPLMEAGLTFQQADAAAKELADRMDYPWSHMTQKGRDNMREIAQAVIEAAHGITAPPKPKD